MASGGHVAWTDPVLETFAQAGPQNKRIAAALRMIEDVSIRTHVLEVARRMMPSYNRWPDTVEMVVSVYVCGGDLAKFEHCMLHLERGRA